MYNLPHFQMDDLPAIHVAIQNCGLAQFITATPKGLLASSLPLFLDPLEGKLGTVYGHLARANEQWKSRLEHEALAIFATADAYITPSWYVAKGRDG